MSGFKVAGVSKHKGEVKVRFANDMTRVKILDKNGHEDINLLELPSEMDKPEIVKYLATTDLYQNQESKIAIDEAIEKYNGATVVKAAKAAVVKTAGKKVTKPAAKKATVEKTAVKKEVVDPATKLAELKSRATKATKAKVEAKVDAE